MSDLWYVVILYHWIFVLIHLQQSLFYLTQAFTVLNWSRLSDRVGRKPVILMGLAGLSASMYCLGLSKTFWGVVMRYVLIEPFKLHTP